LVILKSPFGGDGWIISSNNMKMLLVVTFGLVRLYFWWYWHILKTAWARRAFVWSGEAYLSLQFSALSLMGSLTAYTWYNNTASK
jgi:photosystem II CP43 chlorophyll apoprotein